jgi:hypothetical protein
MNVTLSAADAPAHGATVLARDLSADGIGFKVTGDGERRLDVLNRLPGPIEVELPLGRGRTLKLVAQLMWGCLEGEGPRLVLTGGLRFLDVSDRDRDAIVAFIDRRGERSPSGRLVG